MRTLLIVLTVFEIVLVVAVLAAYLSAIGRRLESIAASLAKVAFGVRAVDSQTASIGPSVTRLNEELEAIVGALPGIAHKAERLADRAQF